MAIRDYFPHTYAVLAESRDTPSGCLVSALFWGSIGASVYAIFIAHWAFILIAALLVGLLLAFINTLVASATKKEREDLERLNISKIILSGADHKRMSHTEKRELREQVEQAADIRRRINASEALRQLHWPQPREDLIAAWAYYQAHGRLPIPAHSQRPQQREAPQSAMNASSRPSQG